jgi:hypothetical protein
MMGRFFRSGSEAADPTHARRAKNGEEDEDEDEELALQRSRVQLVSSRRRQSVEDDDDLDSHRSSTLSHISYLSTPAISGGASGWATPAGGPTLAMQGSFRQQFHDDRCSLPTLESFRAVSTGAVDYLPRESSHKHRGKKSRRKQASQPLPLPQQTLRESETQPLDKADDVYYAPDSPPQSVVSSTSLTPTSHPTRTQVSRFSCLVLVLQTRPLRSRA